MNTSDAIPTCQNTPLPTLYSPGLVGHLQALQRVLGGWEQCPSQPLMSLQCTSTWGSLISQQMGSCEVAASLHICPAQRYLPWWISLIRCRSAMLPCPRRTARCPRRNKGIHPSPVYFPAGAWTCLGQILVKCLSYPRCSDYSKSKSASSCWPPQQSFVENCSAATRCQSAVPV